MKYHKRLFEPCSGSWPVQGQRRSRCERPSAVLGEVRVGVLATAALLVATGCEEEATVNSDAIRTQAIFVGALAAATGDGLTLVRAELAVGGDNGTNLNLVEPDRLTATIGDVTRELERVDDGRYETVIEGDAAELVTLVLDRGPDDAAGSAFGELPVPFGMQLTTDAAEGIPRGTPVTVRWDAPPASVASTAVYWSVEGSCIWSESGETPDDGSFTLDPEAIEVRRTRAGEDCLLTVALERRGAGDVDPVFLRTSEFQTLQRRSVRFTSTPAPDETGAAANDADR